jgi:hypothetical protein
VSAKRHRKHGGKGTRLYETWQNMLQRCYNPNNPGYRYYGGRGIKVCWSWGHSFWFFRRWALSHGYDDSLTIERIDNDGDNGPRNCTWLPFEMQARNTRRTRWITAWGETKPLSAWGEDERCQVSYVAVSRRLGNGWRPEAAMSSPPRPGNRPAHRNAQDGKPSLTPGLIQFSPPQE